MFALIGHGCGALIEHMILNRYRLGIIQGGSHTFVAPIVAMMAVDRWACPDTSGNVIFGLVHACRLQLLSSDQLLILACTWSNKLFKEIHMIKRFVALWTVTGPNGTMVDREAEWKGRMREVTHNAQCLLTCDGFCPPHPLTLGCTYRVILLLLSVRPSYNTKHMQLGLKTFT